MGVWRCGGVTVRAGEGAGAPDWGGGGGEEGGEGRVWLAL